MSGFFGNLIGQALGALGSEGQQKLGASFQEFLSDGGLQTLLTQAKSAGLDDKIRSWIGTGENLPISADQVRNLLSDAQVQALVARTGLPAAVVLPAIAELLPHAVEQHTPDGQVPTTTA